MKKIATMAGSVALLVATVIPVLAANSCSNGTTGALSINDCTINNTSNVTVNNVNDAQISNNVTARSNSGGNSASYNTLGGAVATGNATLNATVSSVANVNTTNVSGGLSASTNNGANAITGYDSDNFVTIDNLHKVNVENNNTASVENLIDVESNAGDNYADYNTGPGGVSTGNAGLRLSLGNHVNDNLTGVSLSSGGASSASDGGGNSGANSTTGALSINDVTIANETEALVNNINDLIVGNFVDAYSNSGGNSASYNTLGGVVEAGGASSRMEVGTEGNINTTTVGLAMGGFANDGSNGVTGYDSDNFVTFDNLHRVEVDNINNKCQSKDANRLDCDDLGVLNYDNDEANTGDNYADYNTGAGGVASGLAELIKTILTHLNDSLTIIEQ